VNTQDRDLGRFEKALRDLGASKNGARRTRSTLSVWALKAARRTVGPRLPLAAAKVSAWPNLITEHGVVHTLAGFREWLALEGINSQQVEIKPLDRQPQGQPPASPEEVARHLRDALALPGGVAWLLFDYDEVRGLAYCRPQETLDNSAERVIQRS
jgi:hypothetical protein